jgi:putative restriction endonuclease
MASSKYGELWNREELILAFELYCRIPFRATKANNPEVIELASLLNRTPSSVARKLGNFGSFDPNLQKRQISGLVHASKLDRAIWDEFHSDWNNLVWEANIIKRNYVPEHEPHLDRGRRSIGKKPSGPSEKIAETKIRLHQSFFREAILSSYDNTCCVTGLKIKECLIASHIVPWSIREETRADPTNGLCLSATFDKLFDSGLISISEKLCIVVSNRLLKHSNSQTSDLICKYHNKPMFAPQRFMPSLENLEWHRQNIFLAKG